MFFLVDYATPSVFESERDRALIGISANARRPVRFHARVTGSIPLFRFTLRALGQAIWSGSSWISPGQLDPVITVHPDRVFFEGFSQDESVYAMVIAERRIFEPEGEVRTGTTNVDFTAWLWAAMGELRSSRDTVLRIGAEGFEVATKDAGGRFQAKVELPDAWVRGFLQVQSAMAMPGTRLSVRAVDLLAAIRFLSFTKAKVSPRALRYEFDPGVDARIMLEPWEHEVKLPGAAHHYTEPRRVRVWGRQRLKLLEPLLPFAERVDIYLKGRGLPHFYAVKLDGLTFLLGLSSTVESAWTATGGLDLLRSTSRLAPQLIESAVAALAEEYALTDRQLASRLNITLEDAAAVLDRLCRNGRAVFDLETRAFRHRELFETPLDERRFFPPDERRERAAALLAREAVHVETCEPEEQRKVKLLKTPDGPLSREIVFRNWRVRGNVDSERVEIVLGETGRLIFGKCGCAFFERHVLSRGPCEHMIALLEASETLRPDLASSLARAEGPPRAPQPERSAGEAEETAEQEDDED
jgi:hypothetical protein